MNEHDDMSQHDGADRDVSLLAEFLKDRDATCPACGYNLRNLTSETCPECQTKIDLRIGERQIRLGWFTLAISPSAFCGVLALVSLVGGFLFGDPFAAGPIIFIGIVSGSIGIAIAFAGDAFIRRPTIKQAGAAGLTWLAHVGLLAMLVFFLSSA